MPDHSRLLDRLLFVALAASAGCADEGGGDDAADADADTDADGDEDADADTDADTDADADGDGDADGDTDSDGDADTGPGICATACTVPEDCCAPNAQDCPGDGGAYTFECRDGFCFNIGCAGAVDCSPGGSVPKYQCFQLEGFGLCAESCTRNEDCLQAPNMTMVCEGVDLDGDTYCVPGEHIQACTVDDDCRGWGTCSASGDCVCDTDDACTLEGLACRR